jgi:hypothetical protein
MTRIAAVAAAHCPDDSGLVRTRARAVRSACDVAVVL